MVEKIEKKVKLTSVLPMLDSSEYPKVKVFIDNSESLNTFFSYKGRVVELHKEKLKISMKKSSIKDVEESIRNQILGSARLGEWLVFETGKAVFDLKSFFKQFSYYVDDTFWDTKNHLERKFYSDRKILTTEEDYDNFKNKGCWAPNSKIKFSILTNISNEDIDEFMKLNGDTFEYVLVEN